VYESNVDDPEIESLTIFEDDFTAYELESLDPLALMFQTGYLTINDVVNDTAFNFDFPNIEVKQAFLRLLMEIISLREKIKDYDQLYISFDSADSLILQLDTQLNQMSVTKMAGI